MRVRMRVHMRVRVCLCACACAHLSLTRFLPLSGYPVFGAPLTRAMPSPDRLPLVLETLLDALRSKRMYFLFIDFFYFRKHIYISVYSEVCFVLVNMELYIAFF